MAQQAPEEWRTLIAGWCAEWGVASLADELTVSLSTRFRTCLGRCTVGGNEIRVAAFLVHASPELLQEVLCHEAAHAAVYRLHGGRVKPHGREWGCLMRLAGFKPRASVPTEVMEQQPDEMMRRRVRWEHLCPACGMRHLAGRPVRTWRCSNCRKSGLEGRLQIRRVSGATS